MTRDYYPVLRRATSALVPNTDEARRAVYDRARHAITHSGLSPAEIENEHAALQAAIERLESETQQATGRRRRQSPMPPVAREGTPAKAARTPGSARKAISWRMIAALATPVLLIGVALY